MIDLEVTLAKGLHWSLWAIDETDAYNLLRFVQRFDQDGNQKTAERRVYADQVSWL